MVLVVTLAIIVLVTIAVLAFFSHVLSERQVESSRTNHSEAEILSRSAQDYVTGIFLREITDPSNSSNSAALGTSIYLPLSPTNIVARRAVSASINSSDTNFFNLVRQSIPSADTNASAHNTAEAARNGRLLTASRWNSPCLLGSGGFTQTNQLPNWIYVTRDGGITNTPSADVIGRFAYDVYDIGGLLDVCAAGYPSSVANVASLKSTVAGADLTQLPGVTSTAADALITLRNQLSSPTTAAYTAAATTLAQKGFLPLVATNATSGVTYTNNAPMSRQDLLRYVRLQNPALTNALPYLTHFSRSLSSPSWRPPASPANSNPDLLNVRFPADATITHYDDQGNTSTYAVKAGEPFVQRRFSLAKLAWLTPQGPSASLPSNHIQYNAAGTAAAIQACFGLQWNASAERWDYVGPIGGTAQGSIKTLAQVDAESPSREPNFFELLKAGILDGSLGGALAGKTYSTLKPMSLCPIDSNLFDGNKDLHVLRIGADIIDCADSDNYPTIIALNYNGIAVEKAGVEDLPYLYSFDIANLRNGTWDASTSTFTFTTSDFVCVPELLNPHQLSSPTSTPADLRIVISSGFLSNVGFGTNGGPNNFALRATPSKDLSALPPISLGAGPWEVYRSTPRAVHNPAASNRLGAIPGATDTDVLAFQLFSYENPTEYSGTMVLPNAKPYIAVAQLDGLVVGLRYKTPGGGWKTYTTLTGYEAFPSSTGINGLYRDDFDVPILKFSDSLDNQKVVMGVRSPSIIPSDPRSSRFSPNVGRYQRPLEDPPRFATAGTWNYTLIMSPFLPNVYPISFAGNFPQMPSMEDPDSAGNPRPPDGNIGFASPGSTPTGANPYGNLADPTRRPVILQRPYQSVAELGYVFRDMPWQTLNFWNSRSADSALLDLFCVRDEPVISAGRVALNTPQLPVLRALLAGTPEASDGTSPLPAAQVAGVATALQAYSSASGIPASTVPTNPGDLAGFMSSPGLTNAIDPAIKIKYQREAIVRGLGAGQTRTWNLFADIVAQSGRFTSTGLGAGNFQVEGETRIWQSVAIDRFTAKVVDSQSENVNE